MLKRCFNMAEPLADTKTGDKVFPQEPCDKNLLLASIRKYKPDGVVLGVEKMIEPKERDYGNGAKANLNVIFSIIGSMDQCILYELDDDGQKIKVEDEITGEEKNKIYVGDGNLCTVFFPFYADIRKADGEDGFDENTTLIIKPKTASYSFFREALIDAGGLPEDMKVQAFATTFKELKEACEGWEFLAKMETIKGRSNSFQALVAERIDADEN